ncbi:hypothetical protein [Hyphomonas sp. ND6WE1B]|uniref:hypothetical protein n=1 Tax=Hyphomonas sp. ND6WE1B TaxID=1848191 RepID=UPI00080760C3|nr:hypothetical protein [Hyphomonas sp. ND6WE1B]
MAQENSRASQIDALRDMVIEAQELAQRLRIDLVYDDDQIIVVEPPRCNNFRATVKERQCGQPCFIELETHVDIGLDGNALVTFDLHAGSTFEDALTVAQQLNDLDVNLRIGRY